MYTIGEFSKICQVSVKTLHHYDRIGLLTPFRVDSFTGYRYYTRIPTLCKIENDTDIQNPILICGVNFTSHLFGKRPGNGKPESG